jgi:hypothetical protein
LTKNKSDHTLHVIHQLTGVGNAYAYIRFKGYRKYSRTIYSTYRSNTTPSSISCNLGVCFIERQPIISRRNCAYDSGQTIATKPTITNAAIPIRAFVQLSACPSSIVYGGQVNDQTDGSRSSRNMAGSLLPAHYI